MVIRCLFQIANENRDTYPLANKVIARDFYVDDFLTGANTVEDAIQLKRDSTKILASYSFEHRKWIFNDYSVLEPNQYKMNDASSFSMTDDKGANTRIFVKCP